MWTLFVIGCCDQHDDEDILGDEIMKSSVETLSRRCGATGCEESVSQSLRHR